MKTLITGGKSAQALKLLKAFAGDQVLLGDYGDIPSFASAQYQFVTLGERNDDTIAHNLLNSCLDQGIERLVPLYSFELEAVVKSAVLFEEFDIQVLLPDMITFPLYAHTGAVNKQNWAVYVQGELKYAAITAEDSTAADKLAAAGKERALNGIFYMDETTAGFNPILFTIA